MEAEEEELDRSADAGSEYKLELLAEHTAGEAGLGVHT